MIKIVKYLSWTVVLTLVAGVAACGLTRLGLQELDQHAREDLGGFYLQTERGLLAYTRQGPVDAPAIILVHGFSTPKFVWEQLTPFLLDAGYQVVTYDHFGRGFSDRPDGPYDSALYQSELSSLIAGLDLKIPLTLVGYSMGGANVVDYAASYPQHVEQLVLIAPAGYTRNAESVSIMIAPVIGEWLFTMFGRQLAYASIQEEVEAGRAPPDMLVKFETQAAYSGYTDALLSTLRDYPMANLAHRYRIVGATDIPVTAIWGTADNIVPYAGARLMAEDIPQLQLITLEGSNHNITYGEATLVAGALLEALNPP